MDYPSAVFLFPETPKIFLDVFDDYIRYWHDVPCIFSTSTLLNGALVSLVAIKKGSPDSEAWEISIPLNYVLAIVDMREGKRPVGFLPS